MDTMIYRSEWMNLTFSRRTWRKHCSQSSGTRGYECMSLLFQTHNDAAPLFDHAIALTMREHVRQDDAQAVRRIVADTGFFRPDEVDVAVELVERRLSEGLASGYHFVFAENSDRVIGYACHGPIACTIGSHDLYWIVVDPLRQRGGLGRQLLRESEKRIAAAGGRRIYIETSGKSQYEPTRRFYERCGYQLEARLPSFYADGDDKLIYTRVLS